MTLMLNQLIGFGAGQQDTGFNPIYLSPSAWYDPSDLTTLWQDAAGTVPVTADGQPVGRINDKSGNGRHMTQATSGLRPLYRTDGTLHWLLFDGTDDVLTNASALSAVVSASAHEAVAAGRHDTVTTSSTFVAPTIVADSGGYISIAASQNPGGGGQVRAYVYDGGNRIIGTAYTLSNDFVHNQRHEGGTLFARLNSASEVSVTAGNITVLTGTLRLGRGGGSGQYLNGRFYGLILKNGSFGADRDAARAWMAAKAGVAL